MSLTSERRNEHMETSGGGGLGATDGRAGVVGGAKKGNADEGQATGRRAAILRRKEHVQGDVELLGGEALPNPVRKVEAGPGRRWDPVRVALQALGVLLLCLGFGVQAEVLVGRVVGVTDGDTVKVLTEELVEERVRLSGIDCPERKQPYGTAAKEHLSSLVFDREVEVHWKKRDRYKRIVGRVMVNGMDVNLAQIESGLAWHYKKYANERPAAESAACSRAEHAAQASGLGLWSSPDPVAPWDWRHR